ncbi:putative holin [Serratia sp. T13T92]|uniref:putative holin n=1 Tax=Serratia sp. T13T92 TaxID=3397496 RepID=UPI0039E0E68D
MADPISAGGGIVKGMALGAIAVSSFSPGGYFDVLAGSAAGAVIYAFTTSGLSPTQRIFLSLASFLAGVVCADDMAALIEWATPEAFHPTKPLGAVITSVIAVGALKFISSGAANPIAFIKKIRGDDDAKKK